MSVKTAENYVNYQDRALEFGPGDVVVPYGDNGDTVGRVTAVYPAIGMVDVEFAVGNQRLPVESLQRVEDGHTAPPRTDSTPGGPARDKNVQAHDKKDAAAATHHADTRRVAEAFVKQALYWAAADRRYRATREELATGKFRCPRCKDVILRPAVYKRRGGRSERLLGCPSCMFLVKKSDIIGHPECDAEGEVL